MLLRLLSLLFLTLLCLVSSPAFAQDAASLKSEGDRLMDGLRYQDALDKYEASYELKSDPALLYNQGRALEGLGKFPEAVDKLLAFREQASPELLNRLGTALTKNIDELRGRVALLSVTVDSRRERTPRRSRPRRRSALQVARQRRRCALRGIQGGLLHGGARLDAEGR